MNDSRTKNIAKMWDNLDKCGGPLLNKTLKSDTTDVILTPTVEKIFKD